MRPSKRCAPWGSLGFAAIALALGCGHSNLTPVEGVVTLDGKPLSGTTVSFMPTGEGRPATGQTDADGKFRLTTFTTYDGALPGEYKVVITVSAKNQRLSGDPKTWSDKEKREARMTMMPRAKKQAHQKQLKTPSAVPPAYSDVQQTPLKQVVPPPGKVEFDLKSGGR